jgi:hypothetical protein
VHVIGTEFEDVDWIRLAHGRPVVGSAACGIKPSGSIKGEEYFE